MYSHVQSAKFFSHHIIALTQHNMLHATKVKTGNDERSYVLCGCNHYYNELMYGGMHLANDIHIANNSKMMLYVCQDSSITTRWRSSSPKYPKEHSITYYAVVKYDRCLRRVLMPLFMTDIAISKSDIIEKDEINS